MKLLIGLRLKRKNIHLYTVADKTIFVVIRKRDKIESSNPESGSISTELHNSHNFSYMHIREYIAHKHNW